jgi:uncharacterized protein (TIGR02996 family)
VDDEAFLRAIAAAPADDAPRLVYADWLDERGDARAALVRAEVSFAHNPSDTGRAAFRERRAHLDPNWWPRLARATSGPPSIFRCVACGLPLTGPVWPLGDVVWLSQADQTTLVPAGFFWVSEGEVWNGTAGHPCVHLGDLRNIEPHPDSRRRIGCCGVDGCEGVNTVCANGHEVGTECSDCWMPHFLHLEPKAVEAVEVARSN